MNMRPIEKEDRDLNRDFSECRTAIQKLLKNTPDGLSDQEIMRVLSPEYGEVGVASVLAILRTGGEIG